MATKQDAINHPNAWFSRLQGLPGFRSLLKRQALALWLPLFFSLLMGLAGTFLIIQQEWLWLIVFILLIPAAVLFMAYPFTSVLVWLLLFPFFVLESMPGARYVFWLLHRAMIPGALGLIMLLNIVGVRKAKQVRFGWVDLAMVTFLVLSLANILLLTDSPIEQLFRFYDRIFIPFCMFWLLRVAVPSEHDLRRLVPAAFVIIVSQGTIGLLSWLAPGLLPVEWLNRIGERTVGSLGNPAVFSTTMIFSALVLMQAARVSLSFWFRAAAMAAVGAAFFFVFFTFSRGSWMGALVVWLGLSFLYPKAMLKLTLIGGLAAFVVMTLTPLASFNSYASNRLFTQTTAESRVLGGAATARMIETRPIQGWGFGNHEQYDERFKDRVLGLAVTNEQSSHNTFLLIAAEMGLPGLFLYLFPAFLLLVFSWKIRSWLPREGMISRSMLFMLWLLFFHHFIAANFANIITAHFFSTVILWMALGWIANIVDIGRTAAAAEMNKE